MPAGLAGDAVPAGPDGTGATPSAAARTAAGTAAPGTGIRDILPGPAGSRQLPGWVPGVIRLSAFGCASGAISYGVMALLGPTVVNRGPGIDEPIVDWMTSHQIGPWAAVVERLDKIGHTWTTWGGAGAAAVCLGTSWRHDRWLPPSAIGAAILVDKYTTLALRRTFGRPGPPGSPGGTYPSGGCDRVVLFSGLIAHMLWREYSGSPRGRAIAAGTVAALAFNQAYSRLYLSKHWFTDILSGVLYGGIMLGPFVIAVRRIAGPAGQPDADLPQQATAPEPAGGGPTSALGGSGSFVGRTNGTDEDHSHQGGQRSRRRADRGTG